MSTYLLLRNNKETGPHTFEEIRGMSLKSYDLIWVVGKSAAWRYPGEINELKSIAPEVPEQPFDRFLKKPKLENPIAETNPVKKTEPIVSSIKENQVYKKTSAQSVFVNYPAEKKTKSVSYPDRVILDTDFQSIPSYEPAFDYSLMNNRKKAGSVRISGRILWISTIVLLFGAGILTGFFISDRRKFFSTGANHPQIHELPTHPANQKKQNENSPVFSVSSHSDTISKGSVKDMIATPVTPILGKPSASARKKNQKNNLLKKDSSNSQAILLSSIAGTDSTLKKNTISNADMLYNKIKANPENYVNLVTGRYSTGIFGGISSVPVTLTNNSPVMLDLVVVTIEYIQSNEKVFKTEKLSFYDLQPGETVTEKAPKSPRGIKITTRITIVNSRQLDLSYSN